MKLLRNFNCGLYHAEFLTEAIYLSVDPYMRAHAEELKLGITFPGGQVAR